MTSTFDEDKNLRENQRLVEKSLKARLYGMWEGKNMFCCKGKIVAGPSGDLAIQICVWFFMIAAGVLYYAVLAIPLTESVGIYLPIAWTVLYICLMLVYM